MTYDKPTVVDLGDLADITLGTGQIGGEDGVQKTIQAEVPDVVRLSLGVFP